MIYDYNILTLVDDLAYVQCFETFNTYPGCDTIRDKLYTYVLGEEQSLQVIDDSLPDYIIDSLYRIGVPYTGYSVPINHAHWPGVWSPDIGLWDIENPPANGFPVHYKNLSYDNWVVYSAIGAYESPFDFMQFFEEMYPSQTDVARLYDFRPIIEPVAYIIAVDEPSSLQAYYVFGSEDYQLLSVPVKVDLTVDISIDHKTIGTIIRDESLVPNPTSVYSAGHDGEYLQSIYDRNQTLLSEGATFNMGPLYTSFIMEGHSFLQAALVQIDNVAGLDLEQSLDDYIIEACGSIGEHPNYMYAVYSFELFLNCPKAIWLTTGYNPTSNVDTMEFNQTLLEPGKDYIGTVLKTGGWSTAPCPDFDFNIGQSSIIGRHYPGTDPYSGTVEVYGDTEFIYFTTDTFPPSNYHTTTLEHATDRFCNSGDTPFAGFTFAFTTPDMPSTEVINSNGEFVDSAFEEIGFKFGVASWDNEGLTDSDVLANIHNNFKHDGTVIPPKQLDGIENWQEVFGPHGNTKGKLTHNYDTPGLKTIHGFVFMYKRGFIGIFSQEDPEYINFEITDSENAIHPLRWKYFRTKINVSAINLVDDFIEVGGTDFTTIPWNVGKTPIISGISEDSKYAKSIDSSIQSYGTDFIDTKDKVDYADLVIARQNDETGDFLGKVNLEQTRIFIEPADGPLDMHKLLMINPLQDIEWHPYYDIYDEDTDSGYWGNYTLETPNYFNENTCVGTLYINGHTLMDDCILEFNFGELDAGSIPDTSGNANYAIVIGDYGLKKASENLHLRRDTTIKKPKIGSSDKAL